jgi:endonuclease YncB( thermonuclease family)
MFQQTRCLVSVVVATAVLAGCATLSSSAIEEAGPRQGRIVHVADGDTVTVRLAHGNVEVRLLAIDTPEKYATRYGSAKECGSLAASALMSRFEGAEVSLVGDPSQAQRDRYGRLLRYVELRDGTDLGALEVRSGRAMPYVYRSPGQRHARYRSLALRAQQEARGNWGPPCNGDFHSSLPGVQDGL